MFPACRRHPACCSFIKQYLNASNADEVEHLKSELETVKAEKAQLEKELAELKVRAQHRTVQTGLCSLRAPRDRSPGAALQRSPFVPAELTANPNRRVVRSRRSKLAQRTVTGVSVVETRAWRSGHKTLKPFVLVH